MSGLPQSVSASGILADDPKLQHANAGRKGPQDKVELAIQKGVFLHSFRTRLCKYYSSNAPCAHGERCQFAHGVAELRAEAAIEQGCLPPGFKTRLCNNFLTRGHCPHSDCCHFAHRRQLSSQCKVAALGGPATAMINRHEALVDLDAANSFDVVDPCWGACAADFGLARAESMDVTNDPRFFAGSVMNKRLMAFKSLTIVSSLMFSTALGQCFKIKKDMNFSKWDPLVGNIAIWEFIGFLLSVVVASMCLFSLYVISHQLFYTIRLTTAGPTGFEQASMYYLTRTMVVWRHLAVSCLFNGLWLFIILVGIQFFVTFYKDAIKLTDKHHQVWISNMVNGSSVEKPLFKEPSHAELDMWVHSLLGYITLVMFAIFTLVLAVVRKQHVQVFQSNYAKAKLMSDPLETQMRAMATRGSPGWKLSDGAQM